MTDATPEPMPRTRSRGVRVPMSRPRIWIEDLMILSQGVPLVVIERTWDLRGLQAARAKFSEGGRGGIGWAALVARALGRVAAEWPVLRRAYMRWPWPHFWEHSETVLSIAVARDYEQEPAVFFVQIPRPDQQTLQAIQIELTRSQERPIAGYGPFRRLARYAGWPRPLRRILWWWGYHSHGRRRAKLFGTLGLSTVAGAGARLSRLLSPLSASLSYGPINAEGQLSAYLAFDHRVMDGLQAAQILDALERQLQGPVLQEYLAVRASVGTDQKSAPSDAVSPGSSPAS